jgi:outer membrane lipoprotein-sorting protein
MKTKISILTIIFIFFGFVGFSQTAEQIIEKSGDAVNLSSMEMISLLKIYDNKGNERTREVSTTRKSFSGTCKTIIKFLSPADVKGTGILIYDYEDKDDDLWIFMPALRKTRRIVSTEKGKSFMGSEFTNADMSKPITANFTYKILGTEKYENKDCWKIEINCKTPIIQSENGYKKKISWVDKSNYLCLKIEFYDKDDKLFKIQKNQQYKIVSGGKYFSYFMETENVITKRKSTMTITKMSTNISTPESQFTAAMLEK